MEMQTTCRTSGESWTPDHADYVTCRWRTCTRCRGDPGEQVSGVALDDSRALEAILEPPYCQPAPGKDTPSWTT